MDTFLKLKTIVPVENNEPDDEPRTNKKKTRNTLRVIRHIIHKIQATDCGLVIAVPGLGSRSRNGIHTAYDILLSCC